MPVVGQDPLADTAYLKRRRGKDRSGYRWYARVNVPSDVSEILRKRTIERCLHTSDFKEAQQRKHAVLAEIFESFERARRHRITSADIEHEAQRHLKEWLDFITKRPDDAFKVLQDGFGNELGLAGDDALLELSAALGNEDWPHTVLAEAESVARSYGVELTAAQHRELCRALLLAEIEALSRAIAIHKGQVPEPVSVLNARAVDPLTAVVRPRLRLAPRQGKGIRVSEAAEAYIAHRNRERRGAWTGQTNGQARTTFRLFTEFTRDAPLNTITRHDVSSFLSALSQLDPNYGRRSAGKDFSLKKLLEKYPAKDRDGIGNKTLNRHVAVIAGMFEWAIKAGKIEGAKCRY